MSDARWLKTLEEENARLKKLLAEAMLDNAIPRMSPQRMVTPDAKQDAVAQACLVHGWSQRRTREALEVDRSSVRYRSTRPTDQNTKNLRRIYGERSVRCAGAAVASGFLGTRRPMLVPDRPNQRWSLDFVSDAFTDGANSGW